MDKTAVYKENLQEASKIIYSSAMKIKELQSYIQKLAEDNVDLLGKNKALEADIEYVQREKKAAQLSGRMLKCGFITSDEQDEEIETLASISEEAFSEFEDLVCSLEKKAENNKNNDVNSLQYLFSSDNINSEEQDLTPSERMLKTFSKLNKF